MMAAVGREGSMGASVRTIPAMGRPFRLGMLYDCCRDQLIPNRTLWTDVLIEEHTKQRQQAGSEKRILENATFNDRASVTGMDPSLKLSILISTMDDEVPSIFVEDSTMKTNTSCVILHHKDYFDSRELDLKELEEIDVEQSVADETRATHVVTGIQYGYQGCFVFNTEYEEAKETTKAVIKLKEYAKRLTKEQLDEDGKVADRKIVDQAELDGIQCSYHGDHITGGRIVNYETLVHIYQNIIQNDKGTTPITVWLYPLSKLNLKIPCEIREIGSKLANEIQDVMEQLYYYEMQGQDLFNDKASAYAPVLLDSLHTFKKTVHAFKEEFIQQLATTVISIRRSEAEETDLTELMRKKERSPFSGSVLQSWLDGKKKEFRLLDAYLKLLQDVELVRDETDLDCLSVDNDCVVCLAFNLGSGEDHILDDMNAFLREGHIQTGSPKRNQATSTEVEVQEPWFHDRRMQQSITAMLKDFRQYHRANIDSDNVKFVIMFRHDTDKDIGAHITVTKDMTILYEDFQVPSEPGQPTEKETAPESITLEWDKPKQGHKYIDHYDIQYREISGKEWHMMSTADASESITIHDLKVDTSYTFQVRAACRDSVANFGKISRAIATFNPPSSPGQAHVLNVDGNSIWIEWREPEYRVEMAERYEIQYRSVDETAWMSTLTNDATNSASLQNLTLGSHYEVRVRAVNAKGVGPFGVVSQTIAIFNPPSAAGKPMGTGVSENSIDIEWIGPKHYQEDIHHYEVEYKVAGQEEWAVVETETAELHTTIKGLLEQTNYELRVRAMCERGCGIFGIISEPIATKRGLLDPPGPPGIPVPINVTTRSIAIVWDGPADEHGLMKHYEVHFKPKAEEEWGVYESRESIEEANLEHLEEDTLYEVRVRAICDTDQCTERFGPFGLTETIGTDISIGRKIMKCSQPCREDSQPMKYKVPLKIRVTSGKMKTRKCTFGVPDETCRGKLEKTIMLVGATGSGKSTLIDGIINYVANIQFEDDFRLNLVDLMEEEMKNNNQAVSQTEWITLYTLHPFQGSRLNFTLNIIDTPGFADTRGIERDKQLVDQIRAFFSHPGDDGVQALDGVCFVTQAPLARLNHAQRYIYDAIQAVFGKDIASNIFILITFADGNRPPVLDALKVANIPNDKCFKFNNSALFADNADTEANQFASMFWKLGKDSFDKFFSALQSTEARSLTLTTEVLRERESLEAIIQGLNPQIRAGLSKLDSLHQEVRILRQHKADIAANKNFKYTVSECRQEKVDLKTGRYVTNCLTCNRTCHFPCYIPKDSEKHGCAAMDRAANKMEVQCTVCPQKCHWMQHVNNPYRFEITEESVERTYEDLKKRYETAEGQAESSVSLIDKMVAEFMDLQENVCKMIEKARKSIIRLNDIALKPNPLTTVDYIDMMIEGERSEAKPGFKQRISMLDKLRETAKLVNDIQYDNFNPWDNMVKELLEDPDVNTAPAQASGVNLPGVAQGRGVFQRMRATFGQVFTQRNRQQNVPRRPWRY